MRTDSKKRTYRPKPYRLRVQRTHTGRGLIAEEPIAQGSCIIEYIGRRVGKRERDADRGKYLFWTSDTTMINGNVKNNIARYINHSCAPNSESDLKNRRIYIFAIKNIKPGEEITYDYGAEFFNKHIRPTGCLCTKCTKRALRQLARA